MDRYCISMHDNDFGRGKKKGDVGRLHDKLDLHIRIIENKEKKREGGY